MATASLTVEADIGHGTREFVAAALDILDQVGLRYELTGMATNVEGDVPKICEALERIHARCHDLGARRVVSQLKIDDRTDVAQTLTSKIEHVREFRRRGTANAEKG